MKHPLTIWREANGLSQAGFARLVGVDKSTINHIEARRRSPSRDLISRIIDATKDAVGFSDLASSVRPS
jgi:transcriptional regulator with XRE-family HTH domain